MKRKSTEGAYTITSKGVSTSSISKGAALSKALTIGARMQREMQPGDDVVSIYVRRLGDEIAGRVDVRPDLIEVFGY